MYIPECFLIEDSRKVYSFIEDNSFGQITSIVDGRLYSSHVPFLLSKDNSCLISHLAKSNPQHLELNGQEVLITLDGAHGYVSPSWYESSGVPTWNYQTVHIYGVVRVFSDSEKLKCAVESITAKYEGVFDSPWEPKYKSSALDAIVGIEISITEIQCKFKLSQNRSKNDQREVIRKLRLGKNTLLAEEMEKNLF